MISLTVKEVASAVGAQEITDAWQKVKLDTVSFDTRKLVAGSLFVPLTGEKDGHDFIAQAIKNGAAASFWSRPIEEAPTDIPVIQVEDTLKALQDLAKYVLKKVNPKVVGITGSNGKTSTKDMTEAVLGTK